MITEVFVNGDSYSASNLKYCITPYSEYLGDLINIPVTNFARDGSSNDRIFRTTLEYCAGLSKNQKPLIIIGFSFVHREETWIEDVAKYADRIKDYPGSKFITTNWLQVVDESTMHLIIDQNINQQMINFYTKLFMLTQTLKSLNLPYFLFSAANNKDYKKLNWDSLKNLKMYQHIQQDSYVADIHNFNIGVWAEENKAQTTPSKYLNSDGHKQFADFLHNKIYDFICQR